MAALIEARKVYEKFINGDSLTDKELDVGIEHFSMLETLALHSGPVFRLAGQEAGRVARQLTEFRNARKEK